MNNLAIKVTEQWRLWNDQDGFSSHRSM